MKTRIALAFLSLFLIAPANAQNGWPTPNGGPGAQGVVFMCLNGSGQAIPSTSSGTCLGAGGGGGGASVTATAAAPSYVEGSDTNPLSTNLTGDLRTIAKQSGTWTVQNTSAVVGQTASGSAVTGNPVRVGMSDGTNAQNWLTALALGDGVNGNNTGAVAPWVYNGTTWDRVRGDATNGIWVNVKAGGVGGGAMTVVDGGDVALGAVGDAAATQGSTGTVSAKLRTITSQLNTIASNTGAAVATTQSGATGNLISCDSKAIYDASTSGSTELVALSSGKTIYICGKTIFSAGTANVKLIYGTGTACATGSANLTPAYQLTAQVGLVDQSAFFRGSKTAASNALCINSSAGVAVQAEIYYTQF